MNEIHCASLRVLRVLLVSFSPLLRPSSSPPNESQSGSYDVDRYSSTETSVAAAMPRAASHSSRPPLPDLPVRGALGMRQAGSMENELVALSNELAGAVEKAGRVVVAVNARPRFASSGVLWRPGIVVTAEHAIRRRDEIGITLPDGRTTSATLAGRDAGTDLAVLKLAENGAPAATFGSTETLRPGQVVLAIGRS